MQPKTTGAHKKLSCHPMAKGVTGYVSALPADGAMLGAHYPGRAPMLVLVEEDDEGYALVTVQLTGVPRISRRCPVEQVPSVLASARFLRALRLDSEARRRFLRDHDLNEHPRIAKVRMLRDDSFSDLPADPDAGGM